jgi:hypothetical protein
VNTARLLTAAPALIPAAAALALAAAAALHHFRKTPMNHHTPETARTTRDFTDRDDDWDSWPHPGTDEDTRAGWASLTSSTDPDSTSGGPQEREPSGADPTSDRT